MNILKTFETAISKVYLTENFAYKTKKHIKLNFLDYSTLDLRKKACEDEVALNSRLSPTVYLGVEPFILNNEFDWAVKMVRLNDVDRADVKLNNKNLQSNDIIKLGTKLGRFHHTSSVVLEDDPIFHMIEDINSNYQYAKSLNFSLSIIDSIKYFFLEWIDKNKVLLKSRSINGWHRKGHGDLRLDHIYFNNKINVLDGTEFSTKFRYIDIAKDIAGIILDLNVNKQFKFSNILFENWVKETNDVDSYYLIKFYTYYRAQICSNALKARNMNEESDKYLNYITDQI